jgi:hypothetical protein
MGKALPKGDWTDYSSAGRENRVFQPDILIMFIVVSYCVLSAARNIPLERQNDFWIDSKRLNEQSAQFGMENTTRKAWVSGSFV